MIKGAPQVMEYESSAARLKLITTDDKGEQKRPDSLPTIEVFDNSANAQIAPATVKADFDFDVDGGLTVLDTVIQMTSDGDWGNDWTVETSPEAALAITIDRTNKTILIDFVNTVSTVGDVETAIAALVGEEAVIEVKTAGTAPNVLTSGGDTLAATSLAGGVGAAMEALVADTEGFLDYDGQTKEYGVGEKLTGGTGGAKGQITGDARSGASGTLHLTNVDGAYQNNEVATDTSPTPGSASVNGVLYSCEHHYDLDMSATDTYPIGQDYRAEVIYAIDGREYKRQIYFDVCWYPMAYPLVTTQDVDIDHPTWIAKRPKKWKDWGQAIRAGHANLVRRIHGMDEQAAEFIKRESEMWRVGMAFTEERIAVMCGFDAEERKAWKANSESVWRTKGYVTKSSQDDGEPESKSSLQPKFER